MRLKYLLHESLMFIYFTSNLIPVQNFLRMVKMKCVTSKFMIITPKKIVDSFLLKKSSLKLDDNQGKSLRPETIIISGIKSLVSGRKNCHLFKRISETFSEKR